MKRICAALTALLLLGSCTRPDHRTHLYLQRFFGECGAQYGGTADIAKAEGECGIITALVDKFNADNPDLHIDVNVVAWPGYPQLTAQMAAGDPPDLVTMHEAIIRPRGWSSRSTIICGARESAPTVSPMRRGAG